MSLPLLGALVIYALATLLWLLVLSRVPLSFAFPFYGLAFLLVPVLAAVVLGEVLRWQVLVGGAVWLFAPGWARPGSVYADPRLPLLIDQGQGDEFLAQLQPELLQAACEQAGHPLTLRLQPGYDHSYYFIASFMGDHLRHHAQALKA